MSEKGRSSKPDGSTAIADVVVSKISGMAADEVQGVRMGGGAARAAGSLMGSITGGGTRTRGVSVEVGEREAAVDLTMSTEYGKPISQLTRAVRDNVVGSVGRMTGLKVAGVDVTVSDIYFPDGEQTRE